MMKRNVSAREELLDCPTGWVLLWEQAQLPCCDAQLRQELSVGLEMWLVCLNHWHSTQFRHRETTAARKAFNDFNAEHHLSLVRAHSLTHSQHAYSESTIRSPLTARLSVYGTDSAPVPEPGR